MRTATDDARTAVENLSAAEKENVAGSVTSTGEVRKFAEAAQQARLWTGRGRLLRPCYGRSGPGIPEGTRA